MPAKRKDDDGPVTGVQAFAEELRAQREAAGLTQVQLAKLMGYSESVIAKRQQAPGRPRAGLHAWCLAVLRRRRQGRPVRSGWWLAGSGGLQPARLLDAG